MKSPFLKTYVALALFVGLGAYIYFVESKTEPSSEKTKEKVISALDTAKVKELTLKPASGEEIKLVRSDSSWRMASPMVVPADSNEVENLLTNLKNLEIDEVVVPSATDLGQYGLTKPKLEMSLLVDGSPKPLTLDLGDKAPAGSGLYAKLPEQPRVFTIPSYLEATFEKKPIELRDRSVLHVKRDAVKTLEVRGPEGDYSLRRDGKGEFAFEKPLATRAGRWSVDGLLGALENLKMDSVVEEHAAAMKPYGLDKPRRTVALSLNDGTSRILEIGSSPEAKKYYAREGGGDLVVIIPPAIVDDLAKGMAEIRAKRLLEVATYEVEGFDAVADGKTQVYARTTSKGGDGAETNKWKRTSPDSKDIETSKVEDLLFKLGGVDIKEFVDKPGAPSLYGLDAPSLKVTIRSMGGKPPVWAELSQKDGAYYARRVGDEAVLKLDPAKAEEVLKGLKAL